MGRPDRLIVGGTFAVVIVVDCIGAAVSYQHEYTLAYRNGQVQWVSSLLPFTVDGMILATSIVLLWAMSKGIRRPWRPLAVLLVGIAATVAANLGSRFTSAWLGAAVAAWSGVALILISDVAMWLTNTRRKLAAGDPLDKPAGHVCPVPVTLDEALRPAQKRLADLGQPSGEQQLANRFEVTRHRVRQALAVQVEDPPAGAVAPVAAPPAPVPAGTSLNGHGPRGD